MKLKHVYLLLAIIGIVYTWYFNIQFYLTEENTSILNFIKQTKTTFPAKSFNADLTVVVIVFLIWMITESLRLKIKYWWILLLLTFLIAIAFTFPLFLYIRANKLEALKIE